VWTSDAIDSGAAIRGRPKLHLSVTSSQPRGTIVAYLYDTDWTGTGRLIAHAPTTWLEPTNTIDLAFEPIAYDVPAGHRLALVIDTEDPLYLGANPNAAKITFSVPSWFDVPLR